MAVKKTIDDSSTSLKFKVGSLKFINGFLRNINSKLFHFLFPSFSLLYCN